MSDTRDLGKFQRVFLEAVTGSPPADKGLRVHHDTWFFGLIETLRAVYPVTEAMVGPDAFKALARNYVRAYPLETPCLNTYGDRFAASLRGRDPVWLADLAAFEWALNAAHHAEDAVAAGFDDLLVPDATCSLHPSAQMLWLEHDVAPLHGGRHDTAPEHRPQSVLVGRTSDDTVIWLPLSACEAEFVARIDVHHSLFMALDAMAPDEDEMSVLQALLARLVRNGLLISN